jgi:hypothetical protein
MIVLYDSLKHLFELGKGFFRFSLQKRPTAARNAVIGLKTAISSSVSVA